MAEFAVPAAIFAGRTAAGAAISYVVNKAMARLSAEDEDLRRKLTAKLPVIQEIFSAGDQQEESVREKPGDWLWNFRDAMQDAEDALDELEFWDLRKEVRDLKAREPRSLKARISGISWVIRQSLSAAPTSGTSKRLKDSLKSLDAVLENAGNFISIIWNRPRSTSSDGHDLGSTRETTRELTTTTVFGRQEEKGEIVEWLRVSNDKLSVCAIVGDGGMGKTTLAQFICQDKIVQDHFGNMIFWVHVSKHFDSKKLVRRILESINRDKASAEAFDSLQSDLTKQLVTMRFLLVLDDAWEEEGNIWEEFLGPLRNNAGNGGRILLTTRMRSVADAVKCQMPHGYKSFELSGLDQEDILKLFNQHAFCDSISNYHSEIRLIGEQISRKLKGCPFIAKVIGQQLRHNSDLRSWNTILNQDIHQCDEIAPRIMKMLKLSYQNLTYEVQRCFRYCSIFPPGYKFKKEEVIEMWVSSGLILQRENGIKDQEDIARQHFSILARKSFFSLVPRELCADPSEDYYVMHDLMYELACSVSSEECSRVKVSGSNTDVSLRVRHLFIEDVNSKTVKIICQSKYLRTLIIENQGNSIPQELMHELKKAIRERKSLRLLKLCGIGWLGMNSAIAELKHLRYISMSATDGLNLYKLFELYHLEVLDIQEVQREENVISIDTRSLPHLRKLYLPKNIISRITYIGRLTTLRDLHGFHVKKEDGHKISELRDLRELRKVSVLDVQNVTDYKEASAVELDRKKDLKLLSLGWDTNQAIIDDQILNKLVPDSSLKHLTISGYKGIRPPMWMEINYLSNLVHLKLDGCIEWDKLPPLGTLLTVEHIYLEHLRRLKYISSSSSSTDSYAPDALPPRLITLVLNDCPDLSELPELPFSLQHLRIHAVGMSSLPSMCDHKRLRDASTLDPQLSVLHIESCDFLSSLTGCFLQLEHYKALTVLKLIRCHALSSLPDAADFQRMSKLQSVGIIDCSSLSSLGGLGALSCLKELTIEHCGNLITTSSSRLTLAPVESSYLKLETLAIDDHQLLVLSPLRNLCHTRRLIISGRNKLLLPEQWLLQNSNYLESIEIRNAEFLQALPLRMHDLHALRSLCLHNTPLLQSLPLMPPNLWVLVINGCCPEFYCRCQVGASEWAKISRIPNCRISERT